MESLSSGSSLDTAIELQQTEREKGVCGQKGKRKEAKHGQNVLRLIKQANAVLFADAD